jgi:hypothetical protein
MYDLTYTARGRLWKPQHVLVCYFTYYKPITTAGQASDGLLLFCKHTTHAAV